MASFPTSLSVYDGKPENSSRVAQSYKGSDNEVGCGTVFFDAPVSGMYFVTVEGMETGATGVFDLGRCEVLDAPSPPCPSPETA